MRVRYKQWRGKDVFHCHKLVHEDQGMMANTLLN
jgi:FtsP/CotA-like multicopper oxidase with cupredoxin domain